MGMVRRDIANITGIESSAKRAMSIPAANGAITVAISIAARPANLKPICHADLFLCSFTTKS